MYFFAGHVSVSILNCAKESIFSPRCIIADFMVLRKLRAAYRVSVSAHFISLIDESRAVEVEFNNKICKISS